MFHFTFSNYGRSAKQHEITVEYSSFSSEYSCQNMSYTLAGKTYPGLIKLISNNKWNLRIMIEKKKKFTRDYSQTSNSTFLPLDLRKSKNGWRWIWISPFETKAILSLRGQIWHRMKTGSQQLRQSTSGGGLDNRCHVFTSKRQEKYPSWYKWNIDNIKLSTQHPLLFMLHIYVGAK